MSKFLLINCFLLLFMIKNQWYAALESKEVPKGKLISVIRFGEKLVLWRDHEKNVICLKDKCIHRGAQLSLGKICKDGDRVECPFHGLQFDGTGKCHIIPANGKKTPVPERIRVNYYPTNEAHDFIWIWWGEPQEEYPALPFFDDIDKKFSYKSFSEVWPVHYSRAIEVQLDISHFSFVHSSTIGRGKHSLVNGPLVEVDKDRRGFQIWMYNEKDNGETQPIKPKDFPEEIKNEFTGVSLKYFNLQFKFPNIWQNYLGKKFRPFMSFVPIDDENTIIYFRFYQRKIRIPILKSILNWIAVKFSRKIFHEDRQIVTTQHPIKTSLKIGEQLFQADLPILVYRQIREELIGKYERQSQ